MTEKKFGFKELLVWQKALEYADLIIGISENMDSGEKHYRLKEQLESCAASISQNIAEGKGRQSKKEFIQYLYIARGSLYESVTLINLFQKRNWITKQQLDKAEIQAVEIASMIKGLINSIYNSM